MATETRSPGTLANDNSAGTNSWTNPGNAAASDNVYATVGGGPMSNSQYLKSTNYSFSTIGDSDTLSQLKLRYERKLTSGGTVKDENVYLVIGGAIQTGTNYADTATAYPGSDTYAEYTITTGLPTVAQLKNSGFGFVTKCKDSSGFGWGVSCDHHEVIATYAAATVIAPAVANLVLTTYAPTIVITNNKRIQPSTLALLLTTYAPAIVIGGPKIVAPATAALTLTTYAPTVTATNNKFVKPATAGLTLTTYAPTILTPKVVKPSTRALTLTGFAPIIIVQRRWPVQRLSMHSSL